MLVESKFRAAWWLPGPHSQTLWPFLFKPRRLPRLRRERLELPDGDFVDLCLTEHDGGPVIALFHGLEGCVQSHYAARMLSAIHDRGWHGIFMHFRGCSGEVNRLDRSYHSGETGDIAFLLDTLAARNPDSPLFAIGYSLGGNALLKYLGERGNDTPLTAAAAVSVPFLLADGADRLNRGLSRLYQYRLIHSLQKKVLRKFNGRRQEYSVGEVARLNCFRDFDEHVTAPLHGFTGADDYYQRSSSRQYLRDIRIPTLILHARDDPFMTPDAIPGDDELPASVRLELSRRGGHVGFVSGTVPGRPVYWLEQRIPAFLSEQIQGARDKGQGTREK
ncbi:MAG: hydrolase [Gammaproteobacteria bacterium]